MRVIFTLCYCNYWIILDVVCCLFSINIFEKSNSRIENFLLLYGKDRIEIVELR